MNSGHSALKPSQIYHAPVYCKTSKKSWHLTNQLFSCFPLTLHFSPWLMRMHYENCGAKSTMPASNKTYSDHLATVSFDAGLSGFEYHSNSWSEPALMGAVLATLSSLKTINHSQLLLFISPQWGAADAEIKVPSGENTELKRSPFKDWSRSVYSHTCYTYCQGFLSCLFLHFRSIHLHFFQNLSQFFPVLAVANTWFLCRPAE